MRGGVFICSWLEDGGKMNRKMLVSLCTSLARLPGKSEHVKLRNYNVKIINNIVLI